MTVVMSEKSRTSYREFILLNVFVLTQHGYFDKASDLISSLMISGDTSKELLFAQAVVTFMRGDFPEALDHLDILDRVDPVERFGHYTLSEHQRMRRYMRARCLFEMGDVERSRDILEGYLRHGSSSGENDDEG